MVAYRALVLAHDSAFPAQKRWELYRLLSEPVRLRLLALAAEEELTIGELAELTGETQPKVSRHIKGMRALTLLSIRRQGTRTLVRLADGVTADPVVADALASGRQLCRGDGSLGRVGEIVRARDAAVRAFFETAPSDDGALLYPPEMPSYLAAFAMLVPDRAFAIDVGTGTGGFLDVLAPAFGHVLALDRSDAQLERARERVRRRGYDNVELRKADYDDPALLDAIRDRGGADAVFASRVLHHAPRPVAALAALGALARPGGAVVVIDYEAHEDERLREERADVWLGFSALELERFARDAALADPVVRPLSVNTGIGPDGHLAWHILCARRPARA
jgi:DNA-binding transcriptional ArsR family regulator/protein-L-isoaspartate O-methyltransferase